ncbi:MAG: UDP-N-acetylenolpyruvoylglucosamine reductase [Candidatus Magasanikbacteria bacterium GW2011_GWC2_37_14]|uniref:UDP-N-acetylenolpyruvoylglucosamine reductase n=1 Tax=Candidatus Magasanikbacteria bacterium GW2011_GWC2_37_14 TaxID=1619046 RepID=A0A0G0GAS7_9BACT|nr:MAG: UDP-N-acetylenolpyruvoylglucosamine reductase [Candidatus Magasanikbacteria bacterium GW2011_GWC2_37_14]
MQELYKQLKEFGHVKINESLAKHTTFKIGGPADFFIEIIDNQKLIELLNFVNGAGIDYFILGGGSNMLFNDQGFKGVVIKVRTRKLITENNIIMAEAGVLLSKIVVEASKNSLSGLEWGVGIPGTVGGAVRGNAGAMGREAANCLEKIEMWQDGEVIEMTKEELKFSYRDSCIKNKGGVILKAYFKLVPAEKQTIMTAMTGYLKQRSGRYPAYPSAGSFFQNIDIAKWPGDLKALPEIFVERKKVPIGWLVEQLDMKGFAVGGAKISDEHGNFIINYKNATQTDILTLIETLKEKVYNKFGVELIPEVEIIN